MVRTMASRFVCWTIVLTMAIAFAVVERPALSADGKAPVKKSQGKGHHLPPYYADVVDAKQREQIYKVQEEYQPKIAALEAQLKALRKEQSEKIAAVLTPDQLKRVEAAEAKAKAAAKEKRKARDAQPAKPAEKAPAAPPAEPKPAQ
jgi:hypothetical protein